MHCIVHSMPMLTILYLTYRLQFTGKRHEKYVSTSSVKWLV